MSEEQWLTIVANAISTVIALGGFLGINAYLQARAKHKAEIKNAEEDRICLAEQKKQEELKKLEQQKKEEAFRKIVQFEVAPLEKRMENIEKNTKNSLAADVLALRCDMKSLRDRVKKQGHADIGDKATMKELYTKYKALGGNNFKEYVDQWVEDIDALPTEAVKTKKSKK